MKKLNVGCGPHHLRDGWINMDLRPFEGVDAVRDATLPFDDLGPFNYIYSEHFLEHLTLEGALKFLANCLTSLEPGGRMRLSTPGIEFVLLTHFDLAEKDSTKIVSYSLATNRAFHGWGHQFLWSRPMLERTLTAIGFQNLSFYDYGVSDCPEFVGFEQHGNFHKRGTIPNYQIVEGIRGAETPPVDKDFLAMLDHEFCRYVRSGH